MILQAFRSIRDLTLGVICGIMVVGIGDRLERSRCLTPKTRARAASNAESHSSAIANGKSSARTNASKSSTAASISKCGSSGVSSKIEMGQRHK